MRLEKLRDLDAMNTRKIIGCNAKKKLKKNDQSQRGKRGILLPAHYRGFEDSPQITCSKREKCERKS